MVVSEAGLCTKLLQTNFRAEITHLGRILDFINLAELDRSLMSN